jgi:tetratricopeptide (TPR) repeat protein
MCYFSTLVFYLNMKKIFSLLFLLFTVALFAQNEQLAQNYFDRGEFEKALISYEDLIKSQPGNFNYFQNLISCYQQLQQFEKAEQALSDRYNKYKQGNLLVEIGYNYQLQKNDAKAKKYYDEAIDRVIKNPNEVSAIAYLFEKKSLVDYALQAYQIAVDKEPKFNFGYQMALLYGQKGDTDKMIDMFLNESYNNPQMLTIIQNQLSRFMTDDSSTTFNDALKKSLLLRVQKNQDTFWNQYLSWFYVQNKEYSKAFIQEKAIYKRNQDTFANIVNLAELAIADDDNETAKEILQYILENTADLDLQIQANSFLMKMKIDKAQEKDYATINNELDQLIKKYGESPFTLSLLKQKADFVSFKLKNPDEGKAILKRILDMSLNKYQIAETKMQLADIFLYEEKFSQALLYYSQIQDDVQNDVIGQEASFKIAKTSYFKDDFVWATHQLKVLKSASTQLIANDALDMFLLISDNTVEDSTQVALKKFAHADFLLYQNKKQDALAAFQQILKEHKDEPIAPVTLLRIGKIYEDLEQYNLAIDNYSAIIENHKDCIYIDEALYFSAEIQNKLKEIDKAKANYEAIIMNHQDSIYFVNAQKKYRQLRGDSNI